LDEALKRLLSRGSIGKRGNRLVVPRPEEERVQARNEADLAARIAEKVRRGGLSPPSPGAIVTDLQAKRAVDRLLSHGVLVRAVDRAKGREILFHREAVEEAQRRLAPLLDRAPGLLVTEVGAALGISRKYSMPLLEHLDAIRFTRRINDRRIRGIMSSPVEKVARSHRG
jgi:selenocysteine-specific elongation factor